MYRSIIGLIVIFLFQTSIGVGAYCDPIPPKTPSQLSGQEVKINKTPAQDITSDSTTNAHDCCAEVDDQSDDQSDAMDCECDRGVFSFVSSNFNKYATDKNTAYLQSLPSIWLQRIDFRLLRPPIISN